MMTIVNRLRQETRHEHEALEEVSLADKIGNNTLTLEEYKQIILANYLVHKRLEKLAEESGFLKELPQLEYSKRKKTPYLLLDLKALEVVDVAEQMNFDDSYPKPDSKYDLLGMIYVMEGATLGGAVILKSLRKNPNLNPVHEYNYYGMYGAELGTRWKQFQKVLLEEVKSDEEQNQVILSAKNTFNLFKKAFMTNVLVK